MKLESEIIAIVQGHLCQPHKWDMTETETATGDDKWMSVELVSI